MNGGRNPVFLLSVSKRQNSSTFLILSEHLKSSAVNFKQQKKVNVTTNLTVTHAYNESKSNPVALGRCLVIVVMIKKNVDIKAER